MEVHVQAPVTPLPTHCSHFSSPDGPFIGTPQLFQPARVAILPAMEPREMEGLGDGHASNAWLHRRLYSLWPLCGVEDGYREPLRNATALELLPPRSLSHGPLMTSTLSTKGMEITRQVNSTQPTHYPAMVVAPTKREGDAERIRGGCSPCCGRFTLAGRQDKTPGIAIDTTRSKPPRSNSSDQFEKRASQLEASAPGEKSRARTQSQVNHSRLAVSNRVPNDNERAYYGLAAATPSFNTIESSVSSNQPPLTNAIRGTNAAIEGAVSGDASRFDTDDATVATFTSDDPCAPAQPTKTGLSSV